MSTLGIPDNLISLTDAVERLAAVGDRVGRSSLSRYVSRYADALNPRRRGRDTLIDFEQLRSHRAENIRLDSEAPFTRARCRADEMAGKTRVERRLRELDLAEREGTLTLTTEVASAATTAIAEMRASFASSVNEISEEIAAEVGVGASIIRPHLRKLERRTLIVFVARLQELSLGSDK